MIIKTQHHTIVISHDPIEIWSHVIPEQKRKDDWSELTGLPGLVRYYIDGMEVTKEEARKEYDNFLRHA